MGYGSKDAVHEDEENCRKQKADLAYTMAAQCVASGADRASGMTDAVNYVKDAADANNDATGTATIELQDPTDNKQSAPKPQVAAIKNSLQDAFPDLEDKF